MKSIEELSDAESLQMLGKIAARVGVPPRSRSSLELADARVERPRWMPDEDETCRIFERRDEMVLQGEVRWAYIVHANVTMYRPGRDFSGAQVVYGLADNVPLQRVRAIAERVHDLKYSAPTDPAEKQLSDMLVDEMLRALDWPVPSSLTGGVESVTTIVLLPRRHLPGGVLAMRCFPVFVDLESKYATIVPAKFWPEPLRDEWQQRAEAMIADQASRARPVTVTPSAAAELQKTLRSDSLQTTWLHVALKAVGGNYYQTTMNFIQKAPDPLSQVAYRQNGIPVLIDLVDAEALDGTVIDFYRGWWKRGFTITNRK